eukprot:328512_1
MSALSVLLLLILYGVVNAFLDVNDTENSKVDVDVFYSMCCQDSQRFITEVFYDSWNTDGYQNILSVNNFYPFGKTNVTCSVDNDEVECEWEYQFGENGGIANRVAACYITEKAFNIFNYYNFIRTYMLKLKTTFRCQVETTDIIEMAKESCNEVGNECDWDKLYDCFNENQGSELLIFMGEKTQKKTGYDTIYWIPWIQINGIHNDAQQTLCESNLLCCVCLAYRGYNKPESCDGACLSS